MSQQQSKYVEWMIQIAKNNELFYYYIRIGIQLCLYICAFECDLVLLWLMKDYSATMKVRQMDDTPYNAGSNTTNIPN